jgi:Flp pilus assembly protein TadG
MTTLSNRRERGAAAVEMALVLPVLLIVMGGLIDLGRAFYTQMVLTAAANEGARTVTTGSTWSTAKTRITQASGALTIGTPLSTPTIADAAKCVSGDVVVVTVKPSSPFWWTLLGAVTAIPVPTLEGKASMQCP